MLSALKKWFRSDDEVIAEAEREATELYGTTSLTNVHLRNLKLVDQLQAKGMDVATVLLLIQVFGVLVTKLLERYLAKSN